MEDQEKKSLLEALLFLSGEPITVSSLKSITDMDEPEIRRTIDELISDYKSRDGGVLITEIANGYQMVTNIRYAPWLRKLRGSQGSSKLSMPALETLAIIAYKQPIIKAEVEQIRGVNSDGIIKSLLERRLIRILGRKEAPGKPLLYGTTKEFLQYFGLKDLTELPTLKDLTREEAL
ncbi:MAG TPA: SMC-Scp complex subunit ScpB [Nitrospiraceae bacterium]|jgi:segregation and condensation protein B|nr:SMC-Scp complex subunit ScpB [Nitrospiraceae bacterium]